MHFQEDRPPDLVPLYLSKHKPPIHFLDSNDRLWWHCDQSLYLFGIHYAKGYYLKDVFYKVNGRHLTLDDLKAISLTNKALQKG